MGLNINPAQVQRVTASGILPASLPSAANAAAQPAATAAPATSAASGDSPAVQALTIAKCVMDIMGVMLGTSGANAGSAASPFSSTLGAGQPPATTSTTGGAVPQTVPVGTSPDGTTPANIFTASDYQNFLLAGSNGGTTQTAERIDSSFSDPNSRFAKSGLQDPTQFRTAVAGMYANQFKAYALGLDGAFNPGDDIAQLSNNLVAAQNTPMTAEAELLSKVAATYRGTGSVYNNPALKDLLVKWGRSDIASQPIVGDPQGDVQSIGGVVKALNEQPDPAIRQAWLQDIFDFANNTPSSPSGAVPDVANYQFAIDFVRNGQFSQQLNNFQVVAGT